MERAVSAVAVATTSGLWARPQIPEETLGEFASEFFAAGGFGRLAAEERQAQEIGNDWLEQSRRSRRCGRRDRRACEKVVGDGVDHHVAGAGVESRNLFRGCSRRESL